MTDPNNGFISTIWGPAMWMVIHCITLNFPLEPTDEDRRHYQAWFEGLGHVLPCGTCRQNFRQNLLDIGYEPAVHFQSRRLFAYLVYLLHNRIREMQQKPITTTFVQCLTKYEQFRAKKCIPSTPAEEGGCVGKTAVACTLQITPDALDGSKTHRCRFVVDPGCDL